MTLVISIFPGIDLLGRAFEEEGFCVVRGPDLLWGGDARAFHPPANTFSGVIGGPPCAEFSPLRHLLKATGRKPHAAVNASRYGNLIPEFERIIGEATPEWFLMENVPDAPEPVVAGYLVRSLLLNNRWIGGVQHRLRRFSFGSTDGERLDISQDVVIFEKVRYQGTVTSSDGGPSVRMYRYPLSEMCVLQGVPADFLDDAPFTMEGKRLVIGNAVPMPLGRALARAIRSQYSN